MLIDTVDFAFGASQTGSLKDAIKEIAGHSVNKRPYQPTKDAIKAAKKKKAKID